MTTLSTHVLDTALGKPAQGVPVRLTRLTPKPDPDPAPEPGPTAEPGPESGPTAEPRP
ncbi:MAG: HIUase/Transthyretin family, partial [Kribbellaceae bacterium]|nr:HIUase/Transthyretin family [Kribbellaceae bacterium]